MRARRENPRYLPGAAAAGRRDRDRGRGRGAGGRAAPCWSRCRRTSSTACSRAVRRPRRARRGARVGDEGPRAAARPPHVGAPRRAAARPAGGGALRARRSRARSPRAGPPRSWSRRRTRRIAADLQRRLAGPALRLYTNRDVVGVELGGARQERDGHRDRAGGRARAGRERAGRPDHARASPRSCGSAPRPGPQPATFAGLAGLGDLVLTCTGSQSRNRALGGAIARGRSLRGGGGGARPMVAEGVRTVSSVLRMAREPRRDDADLRGGRGGALRGQAGRGVAGRAARAGAAGRKKRDVSRA